MVRGRRNVDDAILYQLKQITTRLGVVEISQRRRSHRDDEVVALNPNLGPKEDQGEARLL